MAKRRVNHKALERLGPRGGRYVPERKEAAPTQAPQRRPTGRPAGRGTARRARGGSSTGAPSPLLIAAIPLILLVGIGIYSLRDTTPPPAPARAPMTVTPALTGSTPAAQVAPGATAGQEAPPTASPVATSPVADDEEEEEEGRLEAEKAQRELHAAEDAWLKEMQGGAAESDSDSD